MSHYDGIGPRCPECGGPLVSFSTYQDRICNDCKQPQPWELKEDQQPLVANSRDRRAK
ncbi:hypothetical protein ACFSKY_22590 [Azotobacter chroococcum]|uniref:Uncharacterized protein n=1 Tax=Azotobacter chroococcum TaxID=353 RepID=A0A4R1PG50_9GAMM|nr:hypothetical protein [Azotobacter chroococcum]TCL22077.1 hypothetical protein EV691_13526 [Azotobacter chroococcum]